MINIAEEEKALYSVLKIEGELRINTITTLKDKILEVLNLGHTQIILDMSEMTFIDSSGIGLIANSAKRLSIEQGELALVLPNDEDIKEIFGMTAFGSILNVRDTVEEIEALWD